MFLVRGIVDRDPLRPDSVCTLPARKQKRKAGEGIPLASLQGSGGYRGRSGRRAKSNGSSLAIDASYRSGAGQLVIAVIPCRRHYVTSPTKDAGNPALTREHEAAPIPEVIA